MRTFYVTVIFDESPIAPQFPKLPAIYVLTQEGRAHSLRHLSPVHDDDSYDLRAEVLKRLQQMFPALLLHGDVLEYESNPGALKGVKVYMVDAEHPNDKS